ncbi:MAG TPA: Ig-like domain-containing protein [Candidatus Binatia bacterium]
MLAAFILLLIATLTIAVDPATAQFPGGFIEKSPILPTNRPAGLTLSQINSFLPATRGPFNFPSPYNTKGVRLTIPSDCGGNDCIDYVGYSYWRNTNNHVGSDTMYIFLVMDRNRGGAGPSLLSYNKKTDVVTNLGPLFDGASKWSWANGNGWYFSDTQPTKLYVNYWQDSTLFRYDVVSHTFELVFDVASRPDIFGSNRYVTQFHSSADDNVHSATLRDKSNDADLGCFAYRQSTNTFFYFPQKGLNYDECQIDKSGRWLLIKEKTGIDPNSDLDNRIIDLSNGVETVLLDRDGAGGHSDSGYGTMIAADNANSHPGAFRSWQFGGNPISGGQVVYYTASWNTWGPQHVSFANARRDLPLEQQYVCGSGARPAENGQEANEVICFRLDGSLDVLVVAPVMTDVNIGMISGCDDYCRLPKGNLDITGQYFIWTGNAGTNRMDAFIAKIPSQVLTGVAPTNPNPPPPPPPPPPADTPPVISSVSAPVISSSGATISWNTDKASDSQVEYGTTASYGSASSVNGTMVTSHGQSLAGLSANTTYHYRVKSKDSAGSLSTSADFTLTTTGSSTGPTGPTGPSGGSAPTVAIITPSSGLSVKGKIKVTATASDSDGIAGVQFQLDGQNLGSEDNFAPYTVNWNTGTATNGTHTLTAIARDKRGNKSTSASVTVTVMGSRVKSTATFSAQNVTWVNPVNVTVSGNSLQENCGGCANSGALSAQSLSSGNGYVQFTASEMTTQRSVGLASSTAGTSRDNMAYAISLWDALSSSGGHYVEVYESGVYRGSTSYSTGDVFRIAVENKIVKYYKNGVVFYTSAKTPKYPLYMDTALWSAGSTIANAVISRTP